MIDEEIKYCLDTNVLIQAWQKYYSPTYCPGYWDVLNKLGKQGRIFLPEEVSSEILKTDDDLAEWLKESTIPIISITEGVTENLAKIYSRDPKHKLLVDNKKGRSLADPWVIAHAMNEGATVVTKEEKITRLDSKTVKIPNVCENMGVRCIDDYQMIEELNMRFDCQIV
jgi:predicted nucleic acid-binding protein